MDFIPSEMQLPLVVLVGVLGFLVVIGLSGLSAKHVVITTDSKSVNFTNGTKSSSTPTSTPLSKKTGSVMTPVGRRSARLATRRKED